MMDWSQCPELESVPGKLGGAWVFKGTRLPVSAILQNIDHGSDYVLDLFDGVTKEQIRSVLRFIAKSANPSDWK